MKQMKSKNNMVPSDTKLFESQDSKVISKEILCSGGYSVSVYILTNA